MNYTHYGNAGIPFALVKEYNSYAAMVADFKSGELCTDVRYGEYVIISNDDPENIDFIHNGAIYRRGYNYWDEETGGAVFISNISESQNKVTQEAIEATKEAQSATKEMNDLYSEVKTSETDRVEKEAARVKAENIRNFAEQQRQSNESNRQQTIATWDEAIDDLPSYHKRMYNLEDNTLEKEVVASDSMINEVPAEKMTYCSIEEIGGMSHKSENLIPFPYAEMTKTVNGITFTANEDGSITFSGKLTGKAAETNFFLTNPSTPLTFPNGVYTISQKLTTSDIHILFALVNKITGDTTYHVAGTFELTDDLGLWICVQPDGSASNVSGTIYPMLNQGETALPYEPYFKGLRDTKVTEVQSVGVNLIPFPYASPTTTMNGVTWTVNDDDSITATGTATGYSYFTLSEDIPISKKVICVSPNGVNSSNVRMIFRLFDANKNVVFEKNVYNFEKINIADYPTATAFSAFLVRDNHVATTGTFLPMINYGEKVLAYSRGFRNIFEIPEAVQNLDGYGQGINEEYYNKIILDPKNNVKKFIQKTKRVVLTGTESYPRVGGKQFAINIADMIGSAYTVNDAICTHYNYRIDSYGNHVRGFVTNNGQLIIRELTLTEDNSVAFQSYLAEQYANGTPVIVEYILATPIETDLSTYFTDDNMLKTEEGGTLTFVNEYSYDVLNKVAYYETTLLNNEDILNERGNRLDKTISQDLFTNTIVNQEVDIEINNKNIKNNIEALNDNLIYSEIDEGDEYIKDVPDDVLPYAGITEIGGMTYKSNNLIAQKTESQSLNGITFTRNADGSITVNGTAAGHAYNTMVWGNKLSRDLPNGTYTLTLSGGTIKPFIYIAFNNNTGSTIRTNNSYSFEITDDKKIDYIILNVDAGRTITNETYYVMLNRGEAALPYELYFEGLRDTKITEVESVGQCLFPASAVYSSFAKEIYKDGRRCYRFTTNDSKKIIPFNFKENTQYSFKVDACSVKRVSEANGTDNIFSIYYTDGSIQKINNPTTATWRTLTATSQKNKTIEAIGIYVLEYRIDNYIDINSFCFVEGAEVSEDCKPYFKNTFPIPEEIQSLDGYGQGVNKQYYNKIVLDPASGVKKFVKKARRVDLGDLSYEYVTSEDEPYFHARIDDIYIHADGALKCDKYTTQFVATNLMGDKTIRGGNGYPLIFIKDNDYTNASEFKTSLKGTKLVYPLATPIETDISEYFTDDNLIGVEANGTITAVNEYNHDVPFTVEYKKKKENVSIENITHELGEEEKKVPSQKLLTNTARDLNDRITQNSINIEINNKRLQNLEAALIGDTIEPVIDDTVAYIKDVPSNALSYASINEIGGMSYKCENLIKFPYSYNTSRTINGITWTINVDGSITANGTATDNSDFEIALKGSPQALELKTTEKYTLSGCPKGGSFETYFLRVQSYSHSDMANCMGVPVTFTPAETQYYAFIQIKKGVTANNLTFYPMLNKGDTALPYQPYFTGLRDSKVTALESVGVNKFSGIDGVDFSKSISVGTLSGKKINCDFKPNTRYRFSQTSTCISSNGTDHILYLIVNYTDGTVDNWNNVIARITDNKTRRKITTAEGKTVSTMEFLYAAEGTFLFEEISLTEYTDVDIPYSPYFKNTFSIPEAVQALDGYGQGVNEEYHNKIVLDPAEGVKKFVKKVAGANDISVWSWTKYGNEAHSFVLYNPPCVTILNGATPAPIVCDGYTSVTYADRSKSRKNMCAFSSPAGKALIIRDEDCSTVEDFKAAVAGKTIVYGLPTPTETDISAYFTDDNLIGVEGGGTVTAVNKYEHDVPTTFEYLTKGATA